MWDGWKDANGNWVKTCSIPTTSPNSVTLAIHDRMPVILAKDDYDLWLDPAVTSFQAVSELLKPYDASKMRCFPVSARVNQVQNDDVECTAPITVEPPSQVQLFR